MLKKITAFFLKLKKYMGDIFGVIALSVSIWSCSYASQQTYFTQVQAEQAKKANELSSNTLEIAKASQNANFKVEFLGQSFDLKQSVNCYTENNNSKFAFKYHYLAYFDVTNNGGKAGSLETFSNFIEPSIAGLTSNDFFQTRLILVTNQEMLDAERSPKNNGTPGQIYYSPYSKSSEYQGSHYVPDPILQAAQIPNKQSLPLKVDPGDTTRIIFITDTYYGYNSMESFKDPRITILSDEKHHINIPIMFQFSNMNVGANIEYSLVDFSEDYQEQKTVQGYISRYVFSDECKKILS